MKEPVQLGLIAHGAVEDGFDVLHFALEAVEGFEDRVLTGFFQEAPQTLWPRAVVIEHLSKDEWLKDCVADMLARRYAERGRTRSNTLLLRD